jgi:hypothetical protein
VGRFLKRMFKLGLLAGAAYAAWRWFEAQRAQSEMRWESQPAPYPPQPRVESSPPNPSAATSSAPVAPPAEPVLATPTGGGDWVEPVDGACPSSHPVKAKMSSGIFHVAGGLNYERTKPDRCYRDPATAEADGLRRAAR